MHKKIIPLALILIAGTISGCQAHKNQAAVIPTTRPAESKVVAVSEKCIRADKEFGQVLQGLQDQQKALDGPQFVNKAAAAGDPECTNPKYRVGEKIPDADLQKALAETTPATGTSSGDGRSK